ncbi:hypothetical protein MKW94_008174 [Papaver nudicaule]|uniref:Paramyosin n=1 Tax=Papaver nudicaule TaxID=74823 RepID=A0AA41RTZ3_PAPNU|nr:hypothetical protein [Papaver nudicaule]MCL7033388.1 hypothetical protein [Papaver nudicaule]
MIWVVYSRFRAVGYSFDPLSNSSSSTFTWSSCWSTMVSILMSSKTMKRLESNNSHSWWFGSPNATKCDTSRQVLELQQRMVRLKLELERNKSYKGGTSDVSYIECTLKKGLESEACVRSYLQVIEAQATRLKDENRMLEMDACKRDIEIRDLKLAMSDAELRFSNEKAQLQKVILALEQGQSELETKLKNSDTRVHTLVDEYKRLQGEYIEFRVQHLTTKIAERGNWVKELNENLQEKADFNALKVDRDELNAKVSSLVTDVESRDARICQMEEHLDGLHREHVELISRCEAATKYAKELKRRLLSQMEGEGERQRVRGDKQLCFSLEHYRYRYYEFREAFLDLRKQAPSLDIAYYYKK